MKLSTFLIENNCYDSFVKQANFQGRPVFAEAFYSSTTSDLLSHAMIWDETSEGAAYWSKLSVKANNQVTETI